MDTQTQIIPQQKEVLDVVELTEEQILADEKREYNPAEWRRTIARYTKYKDCKFYKAAAQRGCDYDRFFAVYTLEDGLRFINPVSYGACLHNGGFVMVSIYSGKIYTREFNTTTGVGRAANTPQNRKALTAMSVAYGTIFSNDL